MRKSSWKHITRINPLDSREIGDLKKNQKKNHCGLLFSYIFFLIPAKQSMLCLLKLRLDWKQQTPNELQVCAAFTHLLWLTEVLQSFCFLLIGHVIH